MYYVLWDATHNAPSSNELKQAEMNIFYFINVGVILIVYGKVVQRWSNIDRIELSKFKLIIGRTPFYLLTTGKFMNRRCLEDLHQADFNTSKLKVCRSRKNGMYE